MFTAILSKSSWVQPPPPNLVPNPDMEIDCCWNGWSENPSGNNPYGNNQSTEQVQSGSYSRKVDTDPVPLNSGIASDPFTVAGGGAIYDVSFWIYLPVVSNQLLVSFYDGDGGLKSATQIGFGTPAGVWVEKTVVFQSFTAGPNARLAFVSDQNEELTFFVDTVSFTLRP